MQTLPTMPRDNPTAPGDCCVLRSQLSKYVQSFNLSQNMRVREDQNKFSELLLSLVRNQLSIRSNAPFSETIRMPPPCVK